MRLVFVILIFSILNASCIPTKIAPYIEDYELTIAKEFKRELPKTGAFIFEDPKSANEFYEFINAKFKKDYLDVEWDTPFTIGKNTHYFSFYEAEKTTKTINIFPILIDVALENNGCEPLLENAYDSRSGTWYLVLTVNDDDSNDCLGEHYQQRDEVVAYLKKLKQEYLSTYDYKKYMFMD